MRGSLREKPERGKGYWELRVDAGADPVTGRRRQVSRVYRGGKRGAEDALRALAREVERKAVVSTEGTVSHLLATWLETAAPNLSPSTAYNYRRIIAVHLDPAIGHLKLSELDAGHLDALYRDLLRSLKPATVNKVHRVIHRALNQAIRWEWLIANPADRATPPRVPKAELSPPTFTDARTVGEAFRAVDVDVADFLHLAAATGARRGEICGLRRSDVNLREGSLLIARTVVQVNQLVEVRETKTKRSRRISLDADTLAVIQARLALVAERARVAGVPMAPDPFLFSPRRCLDASRPIQPNALTIRYRRLERHVGVAHNRLHNWRHAHATQLLGENVDVRTVAGRLGHAMASTTLNIYGHFLPAADRRAADVVGEKMRGDS